MVQLNMFTDKKLIVTFDPDEGLVVPENKVEDFWNNVLAEYRNGYEHYSVSVGNSMLVWHLRILVRENKIDKDKVFVYYKGKHIEWGNGGAFKEYPYGFLNYVTKQLMKLF